MKASVSYRKSGELPEAMMKLAKTRMDGFVREFGRTLFNGLPMTLQSFAESCYLQGAEDMATAIISNGLPYEPLDFQI